MQVKAVIMRPDRTNDIVIVKKKNIAGKTFRFDNTTYFVHPDRFMVTWDRPWFVFVVLPVFGLFRRYFTTYYYRQGMSTPIPVPFFDEITDKVSKHDYEITTGKNGDTKTETISTADYKRIVDNGVSGEELAAIFNPWFYRTIAPQVKDLWDYLTQIITFATAAGLVYVIYILMTGNYHEANVIVGNGAPVPANPTAVAP